MNEYTTNQPIGSTVSNQPIGSTVSNQPIGSTVSDQPIGSTVSDKPFCFCPHHGENRNKPCLCNTNWEAEFDEWWDCYMTLPGTKTSPKGTQRIWATSYTGRQMVKDWIRDLLVAEVAKRCVLGVGKTI